MTKARTLADFISDGSPLADGTVDVSEVSGAAPLANPTFTGTVTSTGDVVLGDDDRAIFGAGSDLQIYHYDNNSYIDEVGAGVLKVRSNGTGIDFESTGGETLAQFGTNAAVTLYHNNSDKLATTSTGVDITGDVGADTATITGKTTTDELDLSPIASTIADTAVDVFVYDTSKDSDGGAWRKRTQGTSWYNETLNTATRGSRKEFPSVAVIVAESNQVTIYDGDDPDLPMWMVFNINGTNNFLLTGVSSITSINGKIALGNTGSYARLMLVDFLAEESYWITSSSVTVKQQGIASRNSTTSNVNSSNYGTIVHATVNDVAMTVLPNAPIDAATGLPVPTIAVATNGGTSVICDNGTVNDITHLTPHGTVTFFPNGDLFAHRQASTYYGYLVPASAYTAGDVTGASYIVAVTTNTDDAGTDRFRSPTRIEAAEKFSDTGIAFKGPSNIGSSYPYTAVAGLSLADWYDVDVHTKGGLALRSLITSDYQTGWMPKDTKLATLSDTDDTDVTGSSKLTNDLYTGFSVTGGGFTVNGDGTVSVTNGDGSADGTLTSPSFDLVIGKRYIVDIQTSGASGIGIGFYLNGTGGPNSYLWDRQYEFVADRVQNTFMLYRYLGHNGSATLTKAVVREAEEDRSVNGNGLQVFGTVTKNPVATGADLVAYSGFSSSNYLSQPYNPDMNLNEFSVTCWFNPNTTQSRQIIFARGGNQTYYAPEKSSADGKLNLVATNSSGSGQYLLSNTNGTYYQTRAFNTSVWSHMVLTKVGDYFYIYIDGELYGKSRDTTHDYSSYDGTELLGAGGNFWDLGSTMWGGSLALFRWSATVPSPEQIAKIYEDEKVLFQENAQATLYGSSDAVTALAYDDTTELLHVGTSAGRSDFQGLRRVNNTTNAVGAAISASNGMIVEE